MASRQRESKELFLVKDFQLVSYIIYAYIQKLSRMRQRDKTANKKRKNSQDADKVPENFYIFWNYQ